MNKRKILIALLISSFFIGVVVAGGILGGAPSGQVKVQKVIESGGSEYAVMKLNGMTRLYPVFPELSSEKNEALLKEAAKEWENEIQNPKNESAVEKKGHFLKGKKLT